MYTMDFIKLIFCVMLPVSSFAAGVYLIASFLYEEYNGRKKEKPPENRTEQPEERRQINCENCKAKNYCVLKNEPKAVKVRLKRIKYKYKRFRFPFDVVGYNANCKYCVFGRSCGVKGVKKNNACRRYRERK